MIGDTHKPAGDLPADAVAEVAGACRIAEALERREAVRLVGAEDLAPREGDVLVVTIDRDVNALSRYQRTDLLERLKGIWPDSCIVVVDKSVTLDVRPALDPGLGDLADPLARRCQAAAVILSDLAESLRGMGDRERMVSADEDEFGAER